MSTIAKYTIAFHPKREYIKADRRRKGHCILMRGNSLKDLLRIVDKHINKRLRNPWNAIQVMAWDAKKYDTETILYFTVNN